MFVDLSESVVTGAMGLWILQKLVVWMSREDPQTSGLQASIPVHRDRTGGRDQPV